MISLLFQCNIPSTSYLFSLLTNSECLPHTSVYKNAVLVYKLCSTQKPKPKEFVSGAENRACFKTWYPKHI